MKTFRQIFFMILSLIWACISMAKQLHNIDASQENIMSLLTLIIGLI